MLYPSYGSHQCARGQTGTALASASRIRCSCWDLLGAPERACNRVVVAFTGHHRGLTCAYGCLSSPGAAFAKSRIGFGQSPRYHRVAARFGSLTHRVSAFAQRSAPSTVALRGGAVAHECARLCALVLAARRRRTEYPR